MLLGTSIGCMALGLAAPPQDLAALLDFWRRRCKHTSLELTLTGIA